ncbi:MAG TPA: DNA mismatch repair endonuclease MutL [Gammaproteobacteria bacterium]|nr:DNA mismatch repair endonuclease MutL [Gammaproteobacteria bacterium]
MAERPAMRRIHALSPQLANQIAAGEVVERPASVVKELLENSLDAGAGRLEVEVEQGGAGLIRVRDDGAGIHRDDLVLGLSRHATSKLAGPGDLDAVTTLGFRGEALASIASVCRLRLVSRTGDDETAWAVQCEGTAVTAGPEPAAHAPGTTVEVRDLFFNTPARRRFLRTERTEFGHIEETVRRLGLGRPDVDLTLRHNGRVVLDLRAARSAERRQRRLAAVCGRPFAREALQVAQEGPGMALSGWVAPPEAARSQADLQYVYVNGRVVRDRLLTHALRRAYGDDLYPGRHPAYVLHLAVDPAEVDVNVHPTKHEVRFRQGRMVHDFLYRVVRNALGEEASAVVGPSGEVAEPGPAYTAAVPEAGGTADGGARPTSLLHGEYLLAEDADGPVLVHLPTARARLLQRRLEEAAAAGPPAMRPLLVPVQATVGTQAAAGLEAAGDALARLGLDVDRLGPDTVVVRQVPVVLEMADPEAVLPGLMADLLGADGLADPSAALERIARHAAAGGGGVPDDLGGLLAEGPGAPPAWVRLDRATLARLLEEGGG